MMYYRSVASITGEIPTKYHCPILMLPLLLIFPISKVGASVVQEQCEADGDTSLQQRMLMATGTAMEGTSELVDNEVAAGEQGM